MWTRPQQIALLGALPVAGLLGCFIAVRGPWAAMAVLGAASFLVFLVVSLNRPDMALLPLALIMPLAGSLVVRWPEAGFSLIFDLLVLLPFAALMSRWLVRPREIDLFAGAQRLVWAFLLAALLQFLNPHGSPLLVSLHGVRPMILPMLLFFVAFHLDLSERGRLRRLVWAFTLTGSVAAVWGLKQHFLGLTDAEQEYARQIGTFWVGGDVRIFSTFIAPSGLAGYVAGLALITFSFALATRTHTQKILALAGWGVFTIALVFTHLRGALLGYLTGMLFLLISRPVMAGKSRQAFALLFALVGGYLAFALLLGPQVAEQASPENVAARRVLSILAPVRESAFQLRVSLWKELLPVAGQNPLGLGLGSTAGVSARFGDLLSAGAIHPDNIYVAVLLETGWVGGLLFTAIVFYVVVAGFRAAAQTSAARDEWLFRGAVAYLMMMAIAQVADLLAFALGISHLYWLASGVVARRVCRLNADKSLGKPQAAESPWPLG
jgi:O-Antigen ligase